MQGDENYTNLNQLEENRVYAMASLVQRPTDYMRNYEKTMYFDACCRGNDIFFYARKCVSCREFAAVDFPK